MEGDAFPLYPGRGMAKPIAPDRAHGKRQDMAQIAPHELGAGKRLHAPGIAMGAVLPGKRDAPLVDAQDTGIADGGAANISAEILDGALAIAEALEMHAPVLLPNGGINGAQAGVFGKRDELLELLGEEMPEGASQHGLGHKEAGTLDGDNTPLLTQARARHDAMEMGMEEQSLVPRVQDHGEAALVSPEPARVGKCPGKSPACRRKEEIIELPGSLGEEERSQFLGQREGDHEVGGSDTLTKFSFHPESGGLFAALGAGAVIAGMVNKLAGPAWDAGMEMPTHGRCAAMGERPEGATPRSSLHGMIPQKVRQKAAQRPDHGGLCQAERRIFPTGAGRG